MAQHTATTGLIFTIIFLVIVSAVYVLAGPSSDTARMQRMDASEGYGQWVSVQTADRAGQGASSDEPYDYSLDRLTIHIEDFSPDNRINRADPDYRLYLHDSGVRVCNR